MLHRKENRHLTELLIYSGADKVERMIVYLSGIGSGPGGAGSQEILYGKSLSHLENISVTPERKESLKELAEYLLERECLRIDKLANVASA